MANATSSAAVHDADAQRKIVNRLRRAQGQLAAVITAAENDADCREVAQQLAAVSKALDRAGFLVISTALKDCLANPDAEDIPQAEELEKLFLSLARPGSDPTRNMRGTPSKPRNARSRRFRVLSPMSSTCGRRVLRLASLR